MPGSARESNFAAGERRVLAGMPVGEYLSVHSRSGTWAMASSADQPMPAARYGEATRRYRHLVCAGPQYADTDGR
ncbi:hypothetical protein FBY35_0215 [Streptomyces sp. SLBN-118]|nr:hypothetical protein FBY35_0215 [Streptomyces sp. SLBN-118]